VVYFPQETGGDVAGRDHSHQRLVLAEHGEAMVPVPVEIADGERYGHVVFQYDQVFRHVQLDRFVDIPEVERLDDIVHAHDTQQPSVGYDGNTGNRFLAHEMLDSPHGGSQGDTHQ
jgi:hypothetical protein